MSSAIVTGATGILGREIVKELCSRPEEWNTIYTMSRSKKDDFGPRVKHTHLDLTATAESMCDGLKNVEADYVFFAAYLQKDTDDENTRVNGDMLSAFCKALELTGAASKIKRFVLVTGAKNYGVHLGRVKIPMQETDPRMPEPPYPPNFYYRQQDILYDFCKRNCVEWNVAFASEVLGFAQGNFMNLASATAIYAVVSKELGDELVFPGSEVFYNNVTCFTDAALHAQFLRWMALEPRAANEGFNVANGDAESWMNLWPRVAKYFGLKVPADQFSREAPLASDKALVSEPPMSVVAKDIGLKGHTPQSYIRQRVDLVKWSKTQEVKDAWKRLADREGLDPEALSKASWAFAGFAWGRDYNNILSMSKSRKIGWTGYLDTWENLESIFRILEDKKVIPKH
ncbi:related to wound-inducible protein AWI 31 [Fusarium oxysporum]|uniref:Related to wound-inducible protein AWI 31 n=1 Tax=Fusarium oxysporum TaxID=5507 RepID=A0A2H3T5F1_FUSOX|nr:related to wound-inducible protein AWI 31 [Fusarium oxysporum]